MSMSHSDTPELGPDGIGGVSSFAALVQVVRLWKRQFWRLTLGIAVSVASLISGIALLALAGGTTVTGPHAPLWIAGGLFAATGALRVLGVFRVAIRYAERLATHDAMFRALADLRGWFFRRLARSSSGGIGFRHSADLLSRLVSDIEALDAIYLRINVPVVGALVALPILLVVLGLRDLPLAIVVAGLFAICAFVVPAVAARVTIAAGGRLAARQSELRVAVVDAVVGIREIRAFGAEGRMLAATQGRESRLIAAQLDLARRASLADTMAFLLGQAALLAVLAAASTGLGDAAVLPGAAGKGGLAFVAIAVFLVLGVFETAAGLPRAGVLLGHAVAASRRVVDAASGPVMRPRFANTIGNPTNNPTGNSLIAPGSGTVKGPGTVKGSSTVKGLGVGTNMGARGHALAFENVSFGWEPGRPVLDGASFDIPERACVAILGPSGAGKSTIAALVLGIARPDAGRITLGGIDIGDLDPAELRRRVAFLDQSTHLFADTIRENLALGRRDADETAMWAALDTAAIGDWVRSQPDGLDTWLGEGGALVSGGQGRRVALARALLSAAPILILDEPASGLDWQTERAFLSTLYRNAGDRTVILIAHRLTGVERIDRLWRLAGGRLAAAAA